MWLLILSFPNVASMWIIWIRYYSNCSHIKSTMWILFGIYAKCGFKLDYVADYIRNHNKPHSSTQNVGSSLLQSGLLLIGPSFTVTTETKTHIKSTLHFFELLDRSKSQSKVLPANSLMSRLQTRKFTTQELIIYVLNKSEHKSVLH